MKKIPQIVYAALALLAVLGLSWLSTGYDKEHGPQHKASATDYSRQEDEIMGLLPGDFFSAEGKIYLVTGYHDPAGYFEAKASPNSINRSFSTRQLAPKLDKAVLNCECNSDYEFYAGLWMNQGFKPISLADRQVNPR